VRGRHLGGQCRAHRGVAGRGNGSRATVSAAVTLVKAETDDVAALVQALLASGLLASVDASLNGFELTGVTPPASG